MHILSIAHAYPRWDGDVAGAFIERLICALQDRGHVASVIVPSEDGNGGVQTRHGVRVIRARYAPAKGETLAYTGRMVEGARSFAGKLKFSSLVFSQMWSALEEWRAGPVDVIHAHWWIPGGVAAWFASLLGRGPYVVTLHGTDVAVLEQSASARSLARSVLKRANAVTAVSSYLAQRAADTVGLGARNITVQPMPLDVSHYSRISSGGGGVVTLGRLVQQKRIDVVLEAVALLHKRGRRIRVTVIGDGPERRALEYRAEHLGILPYTRFLGAVKPEAIPDALDNADVFAFPAFREGLGLAVAEALMLGIPVVATEQGGGVIDLLPTSAASRIVGGGRADEMAGAIEALLEDPGSRQEATKEGALLKERLAPAYVARVFESIYGRVLEARGVSRA